MARAVGGLDCLGLGLWDFIELRILRSLDFGVWGGLGLEGGPGFGKG